MDEVGRQHPVVKGEVVIQGKAVIEKRHQHVGRKLRLKVTRVLVDVLCPLQ